ncbi:flippase-like domain-containing protein [Sphingosinicellaceae bacterium]|nr:flippase-like domain-containing protein [Sphingosinicellaceae bacterium]
MKAGTIVLLLTVAGLAVAAWVIGEVGVAPVLAAMRTIGGGGFAVFCLWSLLVLTVLGGAWAAVAPGSGVGFGEFVWARTVREGATDVLPFSQIGGLVVGGRALSARGVAEPLVYASMIADLTTEMASQLVFTLAGVGLLVLALDGRTDPAGLRALACGGLGVTAAVMAAFAFGQRRVLGLAGSLGARLLPSIAGSLAAVQAALDTCYRDRGRVLLSFALNLAAWVLSGAGAWIALRFMGVEITLLSVLAIESLIFAVRSIAFVVPGAVGIQEGAYALVGPLFGLDPQTAVALSLLKRARDLAIGIPAMLAWQLLESRRLIGRSR